MTISPGTRIKELRSLSEMSQEELGRRVGVQRAAINKYEKGTVTNIPLQTIEKIANVFGVSPTYIVGWDKVELHDPLSLEVKIIQGVKQIFGTNAVRLLEIYVLLNKVGKKRLLQCAEELSQVYGEDNK